VHVKIYLSVYVYVSECVFTCSLYRLTMGKRTKKKTLAANVRVYVESYCPMGPLL